MTHEFLSWCDKLRSRQGGEDEWQEMMRNKQRISLPQFLAACDVSGLLDPGETFSDWWATAQQSDVSTGVYMSHWYDRNGIVVVYFIQTAGFEAVFTP